MRCCPCKGYFQPWRVQLLGCAYGQSDTFTFSCSTPLRFKKPKEHFGNSYIKSRYLKLVAHVSKLTLWSEVPRRGLVEADRARSLSSVSAGTVTLCQHQLINTAASGRGAAGATFKPQISSNKNASFLTPTLCILRIMVLSLYGMGFLTY